MELNALMNAMLSGENIESISRLAGVSEEETKRVLASTLPQMLAGAQGQATDETTAEGFSRALTDHAQDDTTDMRGFLTGVDQIDGGKILAHLLGGGQTALMETTAASSGLKPAQVVKILSIVAPLLMSLLGQQAQQEGNSAAGVGSLMTALLGKTDTASLIQLLLFGKKKKKGLLGLLFG